MTKTFLATMVALFATGSVLADQPPIRPAPEHEPAPVIGGQKHVRAMPPPKVHRIPRIFARKSPVTPKHAPARHGDGPDIR